MKPFRVLSYRGVTSSAATLAITGDFPDATVGTAYSESLPITGGEEPYTLTGGTGIVSGSLDAGFALSITGTTGARFLTLACASPATADTMTFTASVDSTDSQTATSAQSVTVAAAADPLAASIYTKIVAWWERDEVSGTTMVDAHTNALNGIYTGLTLNQSPLAANLGRSVTFPTGNNSAKVNGNALLDIQGDLSVMCWVKRVGTQQQYPKIMWKPYSSLGAGYANYLLQQDNVSLAGKVLFRVTAASTNTNYDAVSTSALGDGVATMLGGRRLDTETAIFVNGAKQGTATLPASTVLGASSGLALNWGYNGDSRDPFVGGQDQSALFKPALTDAEFLYLYNGGAGISYAALKAASGH